MSEGPGPAPKPSHFVDPSQACLFEMVLILAEEVAVVREQLTTMTALSEAGRPVTAEESEALAVDDAFQAQLEDLRSQFSERLLAPLDSLMQKLPAD